MYQINPKCTKWFIKCPFIFQMAIKCINIFQSKAPQNLPKLWFLVWKQTIWQPCFRAIWIVSNIMAKPNNQFDRPQKTCSPR
jgi:hypothetical protein